MRKPKSNPFFQAFGATLCCLSGMTIQAAVIQKADETTNLNVARSLSGGVLPATADIASWSSAVTPTKTASLRTDRACGDSGIKIADLGRAVAVKGAFSFFWALMGSSNNHIERQTLKF